MSFMTIEPGTGLTALIAKLEAAKAQLPTLFAEAALRMAQQGTVIIQSVTPVGQGEDGAAAAGDSSGHLSDSYVTVGPTQSGTSVRVDVVTTQPTKYGWVTQGTGIYGPAAHRIVPLTKSALFWPSAEHPVRSIAGMPPRPYVEQAVPLIESAMSGWVDAEMAGIVGGLGL